VDFRLLGPLELWRDGARVELGGPRECAVLAALVLRRNETATVPYLVDAVWEQPPASPATNLRTYVSNLRRRLGPEPRLETRRNGYQLAVGDDELDIAAFERLAAEADRAGDRRTAVSRLAAALALWRGEPLEGHHGGGQLAALVNGLAARRLAVLERYALAANEAGEHETVVQCLGPAVSQHPLREELWCQLMVALCRAGRAAEALDAYVQARERLVAELGVEPGQRLRDLHARVLCGDPALMPAPVVATRRPMLCQLPVDVADFVGREAQLARLATALADTGADRPPRATVVHGGPGVGKSTLVAHAAHLAASRFTDGHLYLDLAGTSDAPREPAALLAELLGALGVTGGWLPDGVGARSALLRSLLSNRRVLLVLDDAADAAQVRPLLPGCGECAVLVTSRRLLTDLAAARHVELGVMSEDEARLLFTRIVGQERTAHEPDQVGAIVLACAHLPLAIRIAAGKLVGWPAWPLRMLRDRLADESRRLAELRLGDLGVRASFEASVAALPADAVLGFRLLGELGPRTVPGWVLDPLLGRADASAVLDTLVDANLLTQSGIDRTGTPRYRLHDLLRAYAVESAPSIPPAARRAAVAQLVRVWLDLAERACARMPPSLFAPPRGATPRVRLPDTDHLVADPLPWFDAERDTLLGAVDLAARWELDEAAWELAMNLTPYLDMRSRYDDWRYGHGRALDAVRAAGNARGEAVLLRGLAQVHIYLDEYDDATRALLRSRDLCQQVGDKRCLAMAISGQGAVARMLGRYDEALERVEEALEVVIAVGDQHIEAQLHSSRGMILAALGRIADARAEFEEALTLCHRLGDLHREAAVLRDASLTFDSTGENDRATAALDRALTIFEDLEDERCAASTLLRTGRLRARRGEFDTAVAALEGAADIYARNGNGMEEAQCYEQLGDLAVKRADPVAAGRFLTRARLLWQAIGGQQQVARIDERLHDLQ
jgi:DNA-binding SARP family transcriptional activator/Flp pilus assembly protein TadD